MTPTSEDPAKRAKQMANLPNLRGEAPAGAWKPGSSPNLKHGLRSRHPSADVIDPVLDQVERDLETKVPDRDADGDVPVWNREMLFSLAVAKLQVIRCSRYLAQHGETDGRGNLRGEVEQLSRVNERYQRALDRMAMTITARARTGANVQRGRDLAREMAADYRAEQQLEQGRDDV